MSLRLEPDLKLCKWWRLKGTPRQRVPPADEVISFKFVYSGNLN